MTSFAFILGVVPLVVATGAGSASRRSLGTAVFGGMLAATLLAIFLVPVQYYVIETLVERRKRPAPHRRPIEATDGCALQIDASLVCTLLALGLSGCLVGPNYHRPKPAACGIPRSAGDQTIARRPEVVRLFPGRNTQAAG